MNALYDCARCGATQRVPALHDDEIAECSRCGAPLEADGSTLGLQRVAAFTLAALVFYLPANLFPILRLNLYGAYSESTIWDGCVSLAREGEWLVAAVVFAASMVVPLAKLVGMSYLVVMAQLRSTRRRRERAWLARVIDAIGPWAMLDVFLVAVLVALVRLDKLATVLPGPGLFAFTAVVVFTLLASASFDARMIWREPARATP